MACIQSAGYPVDRIVFEHADGYGDLTAVNANPGYYVTSYQSGEAGTIGFHAKIGSTYGFVTAGHVIKSVDSGNMAQVANKEGATLETTTSSATRLIMGVTGDAAFVPTPSSWTMTGTINCKGYTDTIKTYGAPLEGQPSTIYGQKTGRTSSKVVSASATRYDTILKKNFGNLFTYSLTTDEGDSGGPVLQGNGKLVGIVHGKDGEGVGYGCRVAAIISEFGITQVITG